MAGGKAVKDSTATRYHRVKIVGLKPYTHYGYSVSCGAESKSGGFITAASPAQPFKFAAYGDNRTQTVSHQVLFQPVGQFGHRIGAIERVNHHVARSLVSQPFRCMQSSKPLFARPNRV